MEDYNEINNSLTKTEKSLDQLKKQVNQYALSIRKLSIEFDSLNKQMTSINITALNKHGSSMQSIQHISFSKTNGELANLNNNLFSISKYGPISFEISMHVEGVNQITDIVSQINTNINGLTGS